MTIVRQVVARDNDPARVAHELAEGLRGPDLRFAFVFADWRLDAAAIARGVHRGLAPVPSIGATTAAPIGGAGSAVGVGLYGDWLRVGVGVAPELGASALTRSRDAVHQAAAALGTRAERLDPQRHVAITLFDMCGNEEAFCIGSAAAAPQIRCVGGAASTQVQAPATPRFWVNGEVHVDAGVVVVFDSERAFHAVTSQHLVGTDKRVVVTAASAPRVLDELDGKPAASRLRALLGIDIAERGPMEFTFARYIDNVPYVRSIIFFEGERVHVASAVEVGHVLRVMRPGDLIATTRRDLALAGDRVGGLAAMLAFSCVGRHLEAEARGVAAQLADTYAACHAFGCQSFGEQSGMLLVNHTLTGLAIGEGAAVR